MWCGLSINKPTPKEEERIEKIVSEIEGKKLYYD
jgi:hypothetical protein